MARDRDFLTRDCLESLVLNHEVAGYDGSSTLFPMLVECCIVIEQCFFPCILVI